MALHVLGGKVMAAAAAMASIAQAQRVAPGLAAGRDVIVLTHDCSGYDLSSRRPDVRLVVMTDRPSVVEATVALLIGADAYLPVDLAPVRTAAAISRVMRGKLHVELETAMALHALINLAQGQLPHPHSAEIGLALRLRARGWDWPDACASAGVPLDAACDWLRALVDRLRRQPNAPM